jgi:hypothetical protein
MMRLGIRSLLVIAACATCFVDVRAEQPQLLPQELLDDGWISLFDGETTYGWQQVGEAEWEVVDGVVSSEGDKPGWLITTTEWGNFELHLEFKAPAATNSGIFLRTVLEPTDPTKDCYELNLAPANNPFPTGSLVGRQRALEGGPEWTSYPPPGVTQEMIDEAERKGVFDPWDGEWHTFGIVVDGPIVKVILDDIPMVEYQDPNPISNGRIGLQAKEGPIAFRNIRVRPLGLKPIFNGKDLAGWSTSGAELSKFEVTEAGELHLTNGPGQLASEQSFGDFVIQLECKVNGDGLNSGVFFRTLPEGRWQGYESQINHKFKDGDRTKPADFGTGSIYRRQPARRVVADDHEWFTKTIVADGPHFAVWVDGYQVSDWTDTRPEKENPREGLRLGSGVIAIQGHDPTTDFLFRDIRIGKVPN